VIRASHPDQERQGSAGARSNSTPLRGLAWAFSRFLGLSGIGWLLDIAIYTLLVTTTGMSAGIAAFVGGTCGATFAFVTADRYVFRGERALLRRKLALYLCYLVAAIIVASFLVELVHRLLTYGFDALVPEAHVSRVLTAFLAKCIVTPITLIANFLVTRSLIKKIG
jgi:putative flippase GtrA